MGLGAGGTRGSGSFPVCPHHPAVSAQLDPFAAIDLSLLGQPAITKQHGDVDLKVEPSHRELGWALHSSIQISSLGLSSQGEFFGVRGRWQSPFSAQPVELPELQEPMLLVAVTEFVANTAAFVYFTAGALRRNITAEMVRVRAELLPPGVLAVVPLCPHSTPTSVAFQLPRRFPLKLNTESMGSFAPQVGVGWGR